jgi:reverse gyrase
MSTLLSKEDVRFVLCDIDEFLKRNGSHTLVMVGINDEMIEKVCRMGYLHDIVESKRYGFAIFRRHVSHNFYIEDSEMEINQFR